MQKSNTMCERSVPEETKLWDKVSGSNGSGTFIQQVINLLFNSHKISQLCDSSSVVQFKQPKQLEDLLQFQLGSEGMTHQQLMQFVERVIKYSVKTSNPHFYNQLYRGIDEYSLAGSWITDALNTSSATYEVSPVFTLLEQRLMKHLGSFCGWPSESIDGLFVPGGSMSNMFAIIVSRHVHFPDVKTKGVASMQGKGVILVSEDAHYSFVKGCIWMGHGSEAVIKVKTDAYGCMSVDDLRVKIDQVHADGRVPFMIAATAGTTVLGAFDCIEKIAVLAKQHNIWLHVDAAYGGTVLFSRQHRCLMSGIDQADSVTWNLHKLGGVPLQCSAFITRHPKLLIAANSQSAEYLFQSDKYYDKSYDFGDKSPLCGRKVDSLKCYLALLGRGSRKMEQLVDNAFVCSEYLTEKIRNTANFHLVLPKYQGNNVCFWYLPHPLEQQLNAMKMHSNHTQESSLTDILSSLPPESELSEKVSKVCPIIKLHMMQDGELMINYQPMTSKKLPNFFRMVLTCIPAPSVSQMDAVVDKICQLASTIDWSQRL